MNFILLGYIIAWIAVIWAIAVLAFTVYEYSKLTPMQQAQIESINVTKQIIALIISIVYNNSIPHIITKLEDS